MKFWVIVLMGLMLSGPALAVSSPAEMLPDPAQEKRAEALGSQLRCLVCQNESIEDSEADLARDLRHVIRERIRAGDTNEQVIDWMVARYGDFVRLRPPFNGETIVLWLAPLLAVSGGAAAAWIARRRRASGPQPLTADEQRKLAELLK